MLDTKQEMRNLEKHLNYHNYKYYTLNQPEITDKEYDEMYYRLRELEKENPELASENSPTQKVGSEILKNSLEKKEHSSPMLSLDKARDTGELREWLNKQYKAYGEIPVGLYTKADGLSVTLTYGENGYLQSAVTRGNGFVGEDVTHSALEIPTIQNQILSVEAREYRGEVVLPGDRLEKINKSRLKEDKNKYSNSRNAASGILRNKELSPYIKELSFVDHDGDEALIEVVELSEEGIEEIVSICENTEVNRDSFGFAIDGVVLKIENYSIREELGSTGHHPKWAVAFKFEAESELTTLKDIEYQVSRTGRINPVGVIEEIELTGAKINKVTLHNYEFIKMMKLNTGDQVVVERAGDVIPKIIKNENKDKTSFELEYPKECPVCGGETEFNLEKNFLYCSNPNCSAKSLYTFEHFVKRMDIKALGIKTLEQLIENMDLRYPVDLYELSPEDIIENVDNTKDKKANKIYNNIQESLNAPLWRVIAALGIDGCGRSVSKDIADRVKSLKGFEDVNINTLYEIDGVGDTVANNIIDYINSMTGKVMLDSLIELNAGNYEEKEQNIDTRFAITGSFNLSRKDIKAIIEQNGGEVKGFSGKTEVLLAGDSAGSKLEKAKSKGIEVWDREKTEEFLEGLQ
jgi:DNA ligase (NAD+)